MAKFAISSFTGVSPKLPPRYLPETAAQVATDCEAIGNSLKPIKALSAAIAALLTPNVKTLYRFGQDLTSETEHWFTWDKDVDVARSQIAGDTDEWTFYSGDGYPKATYSNLALSGSGAMPRAFRPLGLPAPDKAPTVEAMAYTPKTEPAVVYLSPELIKSFTTRFGLKISLDGEKTYPISVTLPSTINADTVASAINAAAGNGGKVTAKVVTGGVELKTSGTGRDVTIHIKYSDDNHGTLTANGADASGAVATIYPSDVSQMTAWHKASASNKYHKLVTEVQYDGPGVSGPTKVYNKVWPHDGPFALQTLVNELNSGLGSWCTAEITPDGGFKLTTKGANVGVAAAISFGTYQQEIGGTIIRTGRGAEKVPAAIDITPDVLPYLNSNDDIEYSTDKGASWLKVELSGTTLAAVGADLAAAGTGKFTAVNDGAKVRLTTVATGSGASLGIRYRTSLANVVAATGKTLDDKIKESRVYVYTYVSQETDWHYESAPSLASAIVEVYPDQGVKLSGFVAPPAGRPYAVTHRRIYRATAGAYLFVEEIPIATTSFEDTLEADMLAEEIPSLHWTPPPDGLRGLINLPNGIMAGFVGRDVYFCDPYHPHAWPVGYMQTVDHPVVGLGVIDTTLVVLTNGSPYFIQGSHPDSMVVVRTDVEQACLSKRSIVSIAGSVVYASPDGLVSIAPSGSKILTDAKFTREQWQSWFGPSSIHAYEHDLQYHAFYNNGAKSGGFVLDFASGSFVLHTQYQACGFPDLRKDVLFTANGSELKKWNQGSPLTYTWRSKRFAMPQILGFSCMQVEADGYPLTCNLYCDDVLVHTQTVTSRTPFRLPAKVGRDWEVELVGNKEVFNVAFAQSMEELASV